MIAPIAVVTVFVAATLPASTEHSSHPVTVYEGMLSMSIPDDWREIDPMHLEELSMWAADATAGRLVEIYQYGFIPLDFEDDPFLPHILVQIRESGRLRYGDFLHLQPLDEIQSDTRKTFSQGFPPLIMGVAVEKVVFDPSNYCLRLEHSLDLRFRGRVRVLTAAFLTERGLVTIRYADRQKRIGEGRRIFEQIVRSVSLAPEIAYQPRLIDRWPGLPYFFAAALVATALLAFLIHRRRSRS